MLRSTVVGRRLGRAACAALLAVPVALTVATAGAAAPTRPATGQPAHTSHPAAPGIPIAASVDSDLPDPFLLTLGGRYYMYLSSAFGDNTQNVPVYTGRPNHWSAHSIDAVPELPSWAIGDPAANELTWSPAVYKFGNLYLMYLSAQLRGSNPAEHCIGVGSSPNPAGPFYISPVPIVCQLNLGGDIDPQVFVDPHGPNGPYQPDYLVWKSDNNAVPGDGSPAIWSQGLANDGFSLEGQPVSLFSADKSWEMPLVEAPQMALAPDGTVWIFFSAGTGFFTPNYGMGAVRCDGPLGPCQDTLPGPLIASNAQGAGPGEETYFVAPDGSDWLLYSPIHTGDPDEFLRPVEAARIGWGASGPYVAEAGQFPSPTACGKQAPRRAQACSKRADSGSR
jgi:hypothetical protein